MVEQFVVIENVYTADGKKLSRATNGILTYYVYDGNVVVEEQDDDNDETARNVYGRNLITRENDVNKIVYGFNGHGDVVYQANTDGIVLVVYDYDEFGNVVSEENVVNSVSTLAPSLAGTADTATETIWASTDSIDNPYRYAGYEYIEEIGIYDLNARYYNPEIARFLSADPIIYTTSLRQKCCGLVFLLFCVSFQQKLRLYNCKRQLLYRDFKKANIKSYIKNRPYIEKIIRTEMIFNILILFPANSPPQETHWHSYL